MRRTLPAFAWLLCGCVPELDVRNSLVDSGRVLAVIAEPAEARPGAAVRYAALVVNAAGRDDSAPLRWTHCTTPRPLIGNNSVSPECLTEPGIALSSQPGASATGTLPSDACARFGPDPPPGNARPRDADSTGGYYQPLRIDAFGAPWLHFQRLLCNPRNAPADVARDFARDYTPNQNPSIDSLELVLDGTPVGPSMPAGSTVELTLRATAAEPYVWLDPGSGQLARREEELTVSWFGTAGSFEADRTAVERGEGISTNLWAAPQRAGTAVLWAVLRDDRGGAAFLETSIAVR